MKRLAGTTLARFLILPALALTSRLDGQASRLRIVGTDHLPVPFAMVAIDGGTPGITDERGEIGVLVRRIGYQVLADTVDLPDTAATVTLTMSREPQSLSPVTVSGTPGKTPLELVGFYSRWLRKQRDGLRDATFIGPEAIEQR